MIHISHCISQISQANANPLTQGASDKYQTVGHFKVACEKTKNAKGCAAARMVETRYACQLHTQHQATNTLWPEKQADIADAVMRLRIYFPTSGCVTNSRPIRRTPMLL